MNKKNIIIGLVCILFLTNISIITSAVNIDNSFRISKQGKTISNYKLNSLDSNFTIRINLPYNNTILWGVIFIDVIIHNQGSTTIDRVELYIDDSLEKIEYLPPFNFNWDSKEVEDGRHEIKVIGYDTQNNSESDKIYVTVRNYPWIEGTFNGLYGIEYMYCIRDTDYFPGNQLFAFFDWGDGSNSGWMGPYSPGEDICTNHTWKSPGLFHLVIYLKNETGFEYIWRFATAMPKSRSINCDLISKIITKISIQFPILYKLINKEL